ncbi:MAG: metallophosphoesterase family protein [Saprospiraceae bacterium]|nr:metallophosphoesterase family protein [Saprospiraceae bacterium]MBP6540679.1 metallophosphoesterase family protein [Saprospiraceae bacterium]HQV65290.1 metallophosphoesterase family protein [Saprospiraceae bacterium]
MKKIALISDNHSYYGDEVTTHLQDVDEIWHAGDIGDLASIEKYRALATFRAVYGNIDDQSVKDLYGLNEIFECEGIKVFMTHIGGYPGKYNNRVSQVIKSEKPNLYICGHSHICKVMPDKVNNLLHMNPGAYGHHGFHKVRTILKFEIANGKIQNLRAVELGLRGIIEE